MITDALKQLEKFEYLNEKVVNESMSGKWDAQSCKYFQYFQSCNIASLTKLEEIIDVTSSSLFNKIY